jgi:hypothetical protein
MRARPATPPTTPPTMPPMFASPLIGIVKPPPPGSESAGSGPMIPAAASPVGEEGARVGACGLAANGVLTEVASKGVPMRLGCPGSVPTDDRRTADAVAAGDEARRAGGEERLGDGGRAAVGIASELVGVEIAGTSELTTGTCEETATSATGAGDGIAAAATG